MPELDETGAAEQPAAAVSIRDSLNAAFAEAAAPETPTETSAPETPAATDSSVGDRSRDAQGRFIAKDGTVSTEPVAPTTEPAKTTETPALPGGTPQHWSAEDKALVAKLPLQHRAEVIDRFKKMEAGFTPKLQRAAALEKDWSEVDKLLEPHLPAMQQGGWTKGSLVRAWADMETRLGRDPEGAIQDIAKFYRVDLTKFGAAPAAAPAAPAEPEGWVDPAYKAVQDELAHIKQTLSGFTSAQEAAQEAEKQATHQRTINDIQAFAEAKAADGSPSHPHFHDVLPDIAVLAQAERLAGRVPELQALYDKAVWANPETRSKALAAATAAQQRQAASEAKAKADAARRAGSSVSGAPSGTAQPASGARGGSLRQQLAAAYEDRI